MPGDARQRGRHVDADDLPAGRHGLLRQGDDVILVDEAHLDVELGELGLTVSSEVLVAVATCDLVVALHARHHEQLLEQLGALRQGVPAPGGKTSRHQEVTGTLRSGTGQGRGLDVIEVVAVENLTNGVGYLGAQHQGLMLTWTPQVQVAVLETGVLTDGDVLVDLEGQRGRGVENLELGDGDLDLAGGKVRVGVALRTSLDDTSHLDAVLVAQIMGAGGLQNLVTDDDLGQTGCVAKINEGDAAMVASVPDPSGESHLLADVAGSQASGVMGSQHVFILPLLQATYRRYGPRASIPAATSAVIRDALPEGHAPRRDMIERRDGRPSRRSIMSRPRIRPRSRGTIPLSACGWPRYHRNARCWRGSTRAASHRQRH